MWNFKKNIYRTRREDSCPDCIANDVIIGTQTWTGCNANVSTYANGDTIPQVTDPTAWAGLTTGAWCYYNNDPLNEPIYGKLYNWYAINDPRGLAPTGYHVPTDAEWTTLTTFLGGDTVAGGKLKEMGLCHWLTPNTGAINSVGFSALGGSGRSGVSGSVFGSIGQYGFWWCSGQLLNNGYARRISNNTSAIVRYDNAITTSGNSVRFVKDVVVPCVDCVAHDVTIGTQRWTGCNANIAFYNNGNPIPYVDDPAVWITLTTGAWCWYDNDPTNETTYGKLYNWYAVNDPRGIAPTGYHVATDPEWTVLTGYLGGLTIAGGKLKETGLCHWATPNTGATNTSVFTGLPGGYRYGNSGNYALIGFNGGWWSSTEYNAFDAWYHALFYNGGNAGRGLNFKKNGLSLRFIKDVVCPDVNINGQIWTSCNLNVDKYSDNAPIPEITDAVTWAAATTGAWCYYNFDSANGPIYGKLYNWYAVNDIRGLAPSGYHIPTDVEWATLTTFLGGAGLAGGELKEVGTTHWSSPNTGATNSTGFTALGGGLCDDNGSALDIGGRGYFWTATQSLPTAAFANTLYNNSTGIGTFGFGKSYGLSIRLIKN